jgi:hypothetical protein
METSAWLWLDQAAKHVAQRLAETESGHLSKPGYALNHARKRLLDEAYRGSIEIHGKIGDPLEQEPRFKLREWELVNSKYWNPDTQIRPFR